MTGIQIPPSLIPHQAPDPQLSRPALAIDKLAALMPVPDVSQGDVQSSTGETVQARQPGTLTPGGTDPRLAGQTTSTRETLSFAAKAILDLFEGGDAAPARPGAPLLATAPAGQPGATQDLASALARFVDQSGLFYESHLTQWVTGQRPLATLLQEPQATLRNPAQPQPQGQPAATPSAPAPAPAALLPYGGPSTPSPMAPPSATILAELTRPVIYPLSTGVPAHGDPAKPAQPSPGNAATAQAPQTPSSPAAEQRLAAHASAAAHAYQLTAEISHEGHHIARAQHAAIVASWNAPDNSATQPQPDRGPPIHPSSEGVVRQQLELLASQQFRATIDAWPGMPVDWEITRHPDHVAEREAGGAPAAAASWSTRLRLNLPMLGSVDAVLTLGAHGLEARLVAADSDAAARLIQGRADFRAQLEARGIALLNMNVSTEDAPTTPTVIALPA